MSNSSRKEPDHLCADGSLPVLTDTQRAAEYIVGITNGQVGAGLDPVGFLMASHAALRHRADEAEARVAAWQHVVKGLEAHLQDRVAMRDEANPERYLSILQSSSARVDQDSQQIVNARWADARMYRSIIDGLRAEIDTLSDGVGRDPRPPMIGDDAPGMNKTNPPKETL